MSVTARSRRYASLQIGRGIAASLVVLHHIVGRAHAAGLGNNWLQDFHFGFLGVDFFFVLSGFIIAHTLSKPELSAGGFLWRRAVRIFPVFWLVFAVSAVATALMPHLLGHGVSYSIPELLKAILLLRQDISDGRSNPPIVGVAWTLHHEVLFYAIAGLWLVWQRLAMALAAVVLLASLREPVSFPATYLFNPLNLEFAFGVLAYVGHRHLGATAARGSALLGVVLLPLLWWAWVPLDQFVSVSRVWSAGLPLALLVVGLAALEQQADRGTSSLARTGEHLGDWSYALYLSHYPVMLVCLKLARVQGLSQSAAFIGYVLLTLLACIAVAALIHHGFERPVQRRLEAWTWRPV